MNLMYHSTRSKEIRVTASQAILQGLAPDGGLFVPESVPQLDKPLEELAEMNYRELAYEILSRFLTDYSEEELKDCINRAYDNKFDTPDIAPLKKAGKMYYLELFHGATIAFKDMALSILPHLLTKAARKNNIDDDIVILTATSGDTGKAALAGFADVKGTKIIVFYPKDGVSKVQEKQMITQKGNNTYVIGIRGNFDDAQTGVKKIFGDAELKEKMSKAGYRFSSANSINVGRLIPQIVYYVYAYTKLLKIGAIKSGGKINFVVPTGNFGNILAAYYAKKMGLPVDKLICASNDNKVLFDFFRTGIYDRNREFVLTISPSMDILVSSNLERLIYHISGNDTHKTAELMKTLNTGGRYEISADMRINLNDFLSGYATVEETKEAIQRVYKETGYVIDTHTAVATEVYEKYFKEDIDPSRTVIVSTASPYKFAESVLAAIGAENMPADDFEQAKLLEEISGVPIPEAVKEIHHAEVRHNRICEPAGMKSEVEEILKII